LGDKKLPGKRDSGQVPEYIEALGSKKAWTPRIEEGEFEEEITPRKKDGKPE